MPRGFRDRKNADRAVVEPENEFELKHEDERKLSKETESTTIAADGVVLREQSR